MKLSSSPRSKRSRQIAQASRIRSQDENMVPWPQCGHRSMSARPMKRRKRFGLSSSGLDCTFTYTSSSLLSGAAVSTHLDGRAAMHVPIPIPHDAAPVDLTPTSTEGQTPSAVPSTLPHPEARVADVIDYTIYGDDMQVVEIQLDPGEGARAEAGAMTYMGPGIELQTSTGGGVFQGFK